MTGTDQVNTESCGGIPASALILASGLSMRMGRPKALLNWNPSVTFLQKLVGAFVEAGCDRIVCTVNRFVMPFCENPDPHSAVRFVLNPNPEWGRMHSIRLGLEYVSGSPFCFIHNVDNPFITAAIVRRIMAGADPGAWCSPEFNGQGGHPVLLTRGIISRIISENDPGTTLQDVLRSFPCKKITMEDDTVLKNINHPDDFMHVGEG